MSQTNQTFEVAQCSHSGRVRPVVWSVDSDGNERPNTVVCEECWKPISADAPAYDKYTEDDDGWYRPVATL